VSVWKDNQIVNQHETCEEVWDMAVSDEYLYAIRDRDLVIQKFNQQSKLTTHITLVGRAPFCRVDGKLCLLTRDGLDIQVLEDKGHFPLVATLKVTTSHHYLSRSTLFLSLSLSLNRLSSFSQTGKWGNRFSGKMIIINIFSSFFYHFILFFLSLSLSKQWF